MSSILTVPAEILMDVFQANDPAGTEALQLTCRRFHVTILPNVDTLPTRLVCVLAFDGTDQVRLHRAPANNESDFAWGAYRVNRETIAWSSKIPEEIRVMYEMFGRKAAIRKVEIFVSGRTEPDMRLTRLIENFPSVKGAVSLDVLVNSINPYSVGLPTDAVLDHFEHLETIVMYTHVYDKDPNFWSVLFATRAFRRVRKLRMWHLRGHFPAVDDAEMFDFITNFSHSPVDKPRVVQFARLDDASCDALERRFNENIDSIRGQVCAVISGNANHERRYLTNMAVGSEKKALGEQLIRDA